jgi:hypothetical protein
MALLRRQDVSQAFDDQGPTLWGNYAGSWTHYIDLNGESYNRTITTSSTPGDSLLFTFSGSQAWIYGDVSSKDVDEDGNLISYPTGAYMVDGELVSDSVKPYRYGPYQAFLYFRTEKLADATHTINITVTKANWTNRFAIDVFFVTPALNPSPPVSTSTLPTRTAHVGAIIAGVAGGVIGILTLVITLYCFLWRRSHLRKACCSGKSNTADVLALPNAKPSDSSTKSYASSFVGSDIKDAKETPRPPQSPEEAPPAYAHD